MPRGWSAPPAAARPKTSLPQTDRLTPANWLKCRFWGISSSRYAYTVEKHILMRVIRNPCLSAITFTHSMAYSTTETNQAAALWVAAFFAECRVSFQSGAITA